MSLSTLVANSLITHMLYTHRFTLIFITSDFFFWFLCSSDVAKCGACDHVNQITIVDLHLSEGVHDERNLRGY